MARLEHLPLLRQTVITNVLTNGNSTSILNFVSKKSQHLQIRVTPSQKAALKRAARRGGLGVSAYVLSRALPSARVRFLELVRALEDEKERRFALAELNGLLSSLASTEFLEAVSEAPLGNLSPYWKNYLAAMVEQAAHQKGVPPAGWLRDVERLEAPHFVGTFMSLRLHLLRATPVPFRRRNIFVDAGVGDRI